MDDELVKIYVIKEYNEDAIFNALPIGLFECIMPGNTVILKPNWVRESHLTRPNDWEYVITHSTIITAVLRIVAMKLSPGGRVVITDGPQTDSSFSEILKHYPIDVWKEIAAENKFVLEILDLRDHEWINKGGVIIERKKLKGDPKGKAEVNLLGDKSEFYKHKKSKRGYYGADYNISETNKAHDGHNNLYSVSRTIIEANVFINLPKLKTHKKSGITCCLKNLVGINTYKNYLPHHSEGGPNQHGDQFPCENLNSRIEGPIVAFFKQHFLQIPFFAKLLKPFVKVGTNIFGKTEDIIRSGNWFKNDTLWRMVLDLNKVFFYTNPKGVLHDDDWVNTKSYIGIVDGILAGEGNGPVAPDPVKMGYVICGTNPVAIDAVCARLMGFDPNKIPTISNAFKIRTYKLALFGYNDILIQLDGENYNLINFPSKYIHPFKPHFGWKNNIEIENANTKNSQLQV